MEKKAASLASKLSHKNSSKTITAPVTDSQDALNIDISDYSLTADDPDQSNDDSTSGGKHKRVKSKKRKRINNSQAKSVPGVSVSERNEPNPTACGKSSDTTPLNTESMATPISSSSLTEIVGALNDNSTMKVEKTMAAANATINGDDEIMVISSEQYYCDKRARMSVSTPKQMSSGSKKGLGTKRTSKKVEGSSKVVHPNKKSSNEMTAEWSCRICTLINTISRATCEVCGSTRIGVKTVSATLSSKESRRSTGSIDSFSVQTNSTPSAGLFLRKNSNVVSSPSCRPDDEYVKSDPCRIAHAQGNDTIDSEKRSTGCDMERSNLAMEKRADYIVDDNGDSSADPLPLLSTLWGDTITPPSGWKPDVLELTGRRLGSKRKGKSLLLGMINILSFQHLLSYLVAI